MTNEVSHVETVDYTHDATGQLTGADWGVLPDEEYEYDAGGNRIRFNGTLYTNGPANRLVSDSGHLFGYDAEGNMTAITNRVSSEVETLVYDHRNRLVEFVRQGTNALERTTVTFEYDPMGRRIRKEVDGPEGREALTFTYDRDNLWADIAGDGTKVRRLYTEHVDEVLARHDGENQEQWYLTDRLGSVRQRASGASDIEGSADYESFGGRDEVKGAITDERLSFAGREWDAEVELQYVRTRYVASGLARFLSEDAWRWQAGDIDLNRFAGNSPLVWWDPFGTQAAVEYGTTRSEKEAEKGFREGVGRGLFSPGRGMRPPAAVQSTAAVWRSGRTVGRWMWRSWSMP